MIRSSSRHSILNKTLVVLIASMCCIAALLTCGGCSNEADDQGAAKTITYDGKQWRQNEDVLSICLIGHDRGWADPIEGLNGQADVIVVLALDKKHSKVTGIIVPRDTMVDVDRTYANSDTFRGTENMQICLAYSYGKDDAASSELVCTAVSRILHNMQVNHYFTTGLEGLSSLADASGGVTLEALETIPETSIVKGKTVTLTGDEAIAYIRWRDEGKLGSALERQERQLQYIRALGSKLLSESKGSPTRLLDFYNIMTKHSTTNLTAAEFSSLVSSLASRNDLAIDFISLEGTSVYNDDSPWEQFILDKDALYKTILDVYFEPVG